MKSETPNWLGWASLIAFCIVAFTGMKIEITHKHEDAIRHEIKSGSYSGDFHIDLKNR
jgi:hypothetical protein